MTMYKFYHTNIKGLPSPWKVSKAGQFEIDLLDCSHGRSSEQQSGFS